MYRIFAHAGHSHGIESINGMGASDIDHCMPIIIGAAIIIALLIGVIVYLLATWHPKGHAKTSEETKSASKE